MSQAMTYAKFVETLKQHLLHFVSGESVQVKGMGVLHQPAYLLQTSGSTSKKSFIHNLESIEPACRSFLKTFDLNSNDKWGLCLSTSHVAGFSILARSHFGKLKEPCAFEWSSERLAAIVSENEITVLSLVPTQIFDLVQLNVKAPKNLKFVFVGGAKLSTELRKGAVQLGWPLIDCYGSTETFAQMSYSHNGQGLTLFEGWEARIEEGEIFLKGPGLFTAEVKDGVYRSRKSEWFPTGDLGSFEKGQLTITGKKSGLVKIKGSYFDFNKFKRIFTQNLLEQNIDPSVCFLVCLQEDRDGAGVYMVSLLKVVPRHLLESFPEIKGVFHLKNVERSKLGKVQASSLSSVLKKTVLSL